MEGNYIERRLADLKAKAAALCFRSQQDALDYCAHVREDMTRLFIGNRLNIADRYVKGDIGCYLRLHSRIGDQKCDFAFVAVPARADGCVTRAYDVPDVDNAGPIDLNRNEGAVFLGITKLVECPKGVVPSFVWVLPAKQRYDFRRTMFADAPTINIIVEFGQIVTKRKTSPFGVLPAARDGGGVPGLVENCPKVIGDIEQNARKQIGQFLGKLDFVDMMSRIRILIDDMGPRLTVDKTVDECVEIIDVLLCANECQTRTIE